MTANFYQNGNNYVLSSPALGVRLTTADFDVPCLQSSGLIEAQADGRGSAWFFRCQSARAVLRHYYRGGLVAKLSRDQFIWCGIDRTRAFREYWLLDWMCQQGLPVPEPLGAWVLRSGLAYRCDLITRAIPDTRTLAACVAAAVLPDPSWGEVGKCIRQMHNCGVWHADLNAKNILIDSAGMVSLIDFDRCRRRQGDSWKSANLMRLRRSLDKLSILGQISHYTPANWQSLLLAYQE